MPTRRFGRVRKLLKSGQAEIISHTPFTIQLLYDSGEYTQPLTLGIDTGTGHIGVCVTDNKGCPVFAAELETRSRDVTDNMKDRAMHRHARQRHGRKKRQRRAVKNDTVFESPGQLRLFEDNSARRYDISGTEEPIVCKFIRPAKLRFQNRTRPDRWLTPTADHLLRTHINLVKKIQKFLPVVHIRVEYAKFDIAGINNPGIQGGEYQSGRMKGYSNATEYALCRDSHACVICGKRNCRLSGHHVRWLSDRGRDVPENIITVCHGPGSCHEKIHTDPDYDRRIKKEFGDMSDRQMPVTILNSIMSKFYEWLCDNFSSVTKTYGFEIKELRREYGLEKSHCTDAYLTAAGGKPVNLPTEIYRLKQFRRHARNMIYAQNERNYYEGRKLVAQNRKRKTGQNKKSFAEVVSKYGLHSLKAVPAKRRYRRQFALRPGDKVKYNGTVETVKGVTGNNVGFTGKPGYGNNIKNCVLVQRNTGITFL